MSYTKKRRVSKRSYNGSGRKKSKVYRYKSRRYKRRVQKKINMSGG
jgi:hypothetical protein